MENIIIVNENDDENKVSNKNNVRNTIVVGVLRALNQYKDYTLLSLTNTETGYYAWLKKVTMTETCSEDYKPQYEMTTINAEQEGDF